MCYVNVGKYLLTFTKQKYWIKESIIMGVSYKSFAEEPLSGYANLK